MAAMVGKARNKQQSATLLGRVFSNVVWLLGGKGFGAICSLVYLGILTRSLGVKGFGHFSLIFGTSQALIALAGFQTWRVVVRYGAEHVHKKDWGAFGRLGMLCGLLDVVGAIVGCGVAYLAFYQFADALDLNRKLIDTAFWFNIAAVWAVVSAPTGIVRALDRFDVAVYVEAMVPLLRLGAAVAIWLNEPSLAKFLLAWAIIDLMETAAYWAMAKVLCPEAVQLRNLKGWRQALAENPGVGRFFMITYAGATLEAITRHGPLLAVGFFVGTSAAGIYRLAHQLAQGLSKFSSLLTRAVYAEVARARVVAKAADFRKLALQTARIAGASGALVVTLAILLGEQLVVLLGGEAFRITQVILVPLVLAASLELAGVPFEPVLHSAGRARQSLIARTLGVAALSVAVLLLVEEHEGVGAAWGVVIGSLVNYLVMGLMARRTLRQLDYETEPN
jgi:O-antigen/teichoic acid export membrane protein